MLVIGTTDTFIILVNKDFIKLSAVMFVVSPADNNPSPIIFLTVSIKAVRKQN